MPSIYPLKSKDIPHFVINYVCSCLLMNTIRTTHDLNQKFYPLIAQISQNPNVFKEAYSVEDCFLILQKAIQVYNNVNEYTIRISDVHKSPLQTPSNRLIYLR